MPPASKRKKASLKNVAKAQKKSTLLRKLRKAGLLQPKTEHPDCDFQRASGDGESYTGSNEDNGSFQAAEEDSETEEIKEELDDNEDNDYEQQEGDCMRFDDDPKLREAIRNTNRSSKKIKDQVNGLVSVSTNLPINVPKHCNLVFYDEDQESEDITVRKINCQLVDGIARDDCRSAHRRKQKLIVREEYSGSGQNVEDSLTAASDANLNSPKSLAQHCLLCSKLTTLNLVSSSNYSEKDTDLLVMFILKKMLEVPNDKLEQYLSTLGHPRGWISICCQCKPVITEAFAVQKQLQELEIKLRRFQTVMKQSIRNTHEENEKKYSRIGAIPAHMSLDNPMIVTRNTRSYISTGTWPPSTVVEQSSAVYPDSHPELISENNIAFADNDEQNDDNNEDFDAKIAVTSANPSSGSLETNKNCSHAVIQSSNINFSRQGKKFVEKKYKCELCPSLESMPIRHFLAHINYHYERPFKCTECGRFLTGKALELVDYPKNIKPTKHNLEENHKCCMEKLVKVKFETGKIWSCEYCPEMFSQKAGRDIHEVVHHTEKSAFKFPLTCMGCSKMFRDVIDWWLHRIVEHPEVARYGCFYCDELFKRSTIEGDYILDGRARRIHMREHHRDKYLFNDFVCTFCGINYDQNLDLLSHVKDEHGLTASDLHGCPVCFKRFKNKCARWNHISLHHYGSSVPRQGENFVCEECAFEHCRLSVFAEHKYLEHGIEPEGGPKYKCPHKDCSFKCVVKRTFDRHLFKMHSVESLHKCKICGKCFLSTTHLAGHEEIHLNAAKKPFQCEICGNSFAVRNYLYIHKRLSHQNRPFASTHKKKPSKRKMTFKHLNAAPSEPIVSQSCPISQDVEPVERTGSIPPIQNSSLESRTQIELPNC